MSPEDNDKAADRRLLVYMKSSFAHCWDEFYTFCEKLIATPPAQRVPIAITFFKAKNVFPKIEHKSMKSSAQALKFKNLGNDKFGRGSFVEALKMYTKSIAVAPLGSLELAVGYANRSAALYKLERYEACLVDVNRALNENYPESSKQKLYDRKKKCRSMLMNRYGYGKSFRKLSLQEKSFRKDMGDIAGKCQIDVDASDLDYSGKFPVPETSFKNENISNASKKVKLEVNSTFGRHVVADKDIEIGEIIGIEKPYASILKLEYQYSHCANCFVRCEALIPCPACSAVMYCSQRCKDDAFARSHQIECKLLSFLQHFPLASSVWFAIRVLLVITRLGEDLETLMKHPLFKNPMKKAFDGVPETVDSQDPVHLLNMKNTTEYINTWELSNMKLRPNSEDLLESKLLNAAVHMYQLVFIIDMLRTTPFFGASKIEKKREKVEKLAAKEEYAGLLLLKLHSCLTTHSFEIGEIRQERNIIAIENFDSRTLVGSGLYVFHSFFNHSCVENVERHFHKDTLVSRATQPIKAGQQLFMTYGPSFIKDHLYERQCFLLNFEFECSCDACKYEWPGFEDMSNNLEFLSKANISLKNLDRCTRTLHEKVAELPAFEYSPELFNFLKDYLKMFHENFKTPSQDYICGYMAFQILLQSQGNNYVYTRDQVVMSL